MSILTLAREFKYSDLVSDCISRLNELHKTIQQISFEKSNENIVKIQRLKFELGELQILFEQMCFMSNYDSIGTTATTTASAVTTETASQTDEFDIHSRLIINTKPFPNTEKYKMVILRSIQEKTKLMCADNENRRTQQMLCHENEMENQSLTTVSVPIDNTIKNDTSNFAYVCFLQHHQQFNGMARTRCEKNHLHLNQLSHIAVSYEMELQKLDRKLRKSIEKYVEIKRCVVILLDIIDHLKCKLRSTNNDQKVANIADESTTDETSNKIENMATESLNRPISNISVDSIESDSISLSKKQIELHDKELMQNNNEFKNQVFIECTTCHQRGLISSEFDFKKDKSIQTDQKFNQEENIVEEDFCRNFNYRLNESEILAMAKKSNSKQTKIGQLQVKVDCQRNVSLGRQKYVQNNVKMVKKFSATSATDGKKGFPKKVLHVLKPEASKTIVTPKKRPIGKTNTNRTIQAGIHHSTKQTNQQNILRSSNTRKITSKKAADASVIVTLVGKKSIIETETKPKPRLKTLAINNIKQTPRVVCVNRNTSNKKKTILRTHHNRTATNQTAHSVGCAMTTTSITLTTQKSNAVSTNFQRATTKMPIANMPLRKSEFIAADRKLTHDGVKSK